MVRLNCQICDAVVADRVPAAAAKHVAASTCRHCSPAARSLPAAS